SQPTNSRATSRLHRPMNGSYAAPLDQRSPMNGLRLDRVETVLRQSEAVAQQGLDGVGGAVDVERQLAPFDGREVVEHDVGRLLTTGRTADAEAHPEVL